jgi:DNA recombination protein RmuC
MPLGLQLAITFALGGGCGAMLVWLWLRGRATAPDARLENELRQQLAKREAELNQLRGEAVQIKTSLATAQANQASAEKLLAEQRVLHERTLGEAKEAQAKALADLREAFRALSAEALKQSAPEFLRLAEQSFGKFQAIAKGDLEKRQESIKVLVEPLKQQLDTYQKRLQQSENAQADTLGKVKEQLTALAASSQSLAAETAQFRSVLKSNQARGRWGEETLRRVVEAAGLSAHCDFTEQSKGDEGKPDLIVRLPG